MICTVTYLLFDPKKVSFLAQRIHQNFKILQNYLAHAMMCVNLDISMKIVFGKDPDSGGDIYGVLNEKYQKRLEMAEEVFKQYPLTLHRERKTIAQIVRAIVFSPVLRWGILAFFSPIMLAFLADFFTSGLSEDIAGHLALVVFILSVVIWIKFFIVVFQFAWWRMMKKRSFSDDRG